MKPKNEIYELSINNLILWTDNPRINTVDSEKDAILQLFDKDAKGMFNLIKDICRDGLSPANNLLVSPIENNKFIVIEGNRRVSAIKCILNPSILEETSQKKYVKMIASLDTSIISSLKNNLKCSIDTMEHQMLQLEKIHNGEMNGIGRKTWGSSEKNKFMSNIGPNPRKKEISTLLLAYLEKYPNAIDNNAMSCIKSISPTNISRLLNAKLIKNYLGIENYSIVTPIQLNKICNLLLFFYRNGNKVELIYRKETVRLFLLDYQEYKTEQIVLIENIANEIILEEKIQLTQVYPELTKSNLLSFQETNKPSKNHVVKATTANGITHKVDPIIDTSENMMPSQIGLEYINVSQKEEIKPVRKKSSQKQRNFFDSLSWDSLNKSNLRENGLIVLCTELKNMSVSKDYQKYPTACSILMRGILEQSLILFAIKNQSNSNIYTKILKSKDPDKFTQLDKIIKEYLKQSDTIKDFQSIFYNRDDLSRTFKSFANSGTKDFFDMVIHNPHYVQANYHSLEAISEQGLFSFINDILNS